MQYITVVSHVEVFDFCFKKPKYILVPESTLVNGWVFIVFQLLVVFIFQPLVGQWLLHRDAYLE